MTHPSVWERRVRLIVVVRFALPLALVCLIPSLIGLKLVGDQANENRANATENRAALRYICSTTSILEDLAKSAADSIQVSLDDGTYDRLRVKGILTRKNVADSKVARDKYAAAAAKLSDPTPCLKVSAKPTG